MILGTPTYLVFGLRLLKIILPDLLWCSQPPASFISDPRATSSPASEAPKARVCTGGVRPQGFMDQLLSLSRSQQHGEPCTKGSEVGSVQHAGPAAGVSVTVISPATGAQKQPPRHPPTASQGLCTASPLCKRCPPPRVLGSASHQAVLPAGGHDISTKLFPYICKPEVLRNSTCRRGPAAAACRRCLGIFHGRAQDPACMSNATSERRG